MLIDNEEKKNHIIELGSSIMHLLGYHGAGVKDIVKAAGIPKGSFYNYFESKEDFAMQAMIYHGALARKHFIYHFSKKEIRPLQRLYNCFEDAISVFEKDCSKGCFIANLAQEMADANPRLCEVANLELEKNEVLIAELLHEAIDQQELKNKQKNQSAKGQR